jgi:hypothetical protein
MSIMKLKGGSVIVVLALNPIFMILSIVGKRSGDHQGN